MLNFLGNRRRRVNHSNKCIKIINKDINSNNNLRLPQVKARLHLRALPRYFSSNSTETLRLLKYNTISITLDQNKIIQLQGMPAGGYRLNRNQRMARPGYQ